jgi:hypothetical protein
MCLFIPFTHGARVTFSRQCAIGTSATSAARGFKSDLGQVGGHTRSGRRGRDHHRSRDRGVICAVIPWHGTRQDVHVHRIDVRQRAKRICEMRLCNRHTLGPVHLVRLAGTGTDWHRRQPPHYLAAGNALMCSRPWLTDGQQGPITNGSVEELDELIADGGGGEDAQVSEEHRDVLRRRIVSRRLLRL